MLNVVRPSEEDGSDSALLRAVGGTCVRNIATLDVARKTGLLELVRWLPIHGPTRPPGSVDGGR